MVEKKDGQEKEKNKLIVITGPTASGKTGKAVDLARLVSGEIISADSRQVYKDMNLGTGKDLEEYGEIPYHLIDICEAGDKFNLHGYLKHFRSCKDDIERRKKKCILCGGTGLYLETALTDIELPEVPVNEKLRKELSDKSLEYLTDLLKSYKNLHNTTDVDSVKRAIRAIEIEEYYRNNPESAQKADRRKRKPLDALIIGLEITREERRVRITNRLHRRLEEGMIDEVANLLKRGITPENLIYYGLEYKYLTLYLIGKLTYQEMVNSLEIAIHQFAKRQMTWFRGMERRGFLIHWLPYDLPQDEFNQRVMALYT